MSFMKLKSPYSLSLHWKSLEFLILQWFKSYLSDRKKFVVMGDCKSEVGVVLSGVPQVSVLGPLLITYK